MYSSMCRYVCMEITKLFRNLKTKEECVYISVCIYINHNIWCKYNKLTRFSIDDKHVFMCIILDQLFATQSSDTKTNSLQPNEYRSYCLQISIRDTIASLPHSFLWKNNTVHHMMQSRYINSPQDPHITRV